MLIDLALGSYSALRDSILAFMAHLESSGQEITKEQAMLLQSVISCKKHLLNGFIELLRGQSSDSFDNLRKALEYTLFVAHAFESSGAALKWLMGAYGQQAFEDYRSEFKIMKMLEVKRYKVLVGAETKLIENVIQDYEKACIWVHATVISGGPTQEAKDGPQGLAFLDTYVDVDQSKLEDTFLWELRAHQNILELLYLLLKRTGIDVSEVNTWENTINTLRSSIRKDAEQIQLQRAKTGLQHHEIAQRAYFCWIDRGGGDWNDLEDWFAAEDELANEAALKRDVQPAPS